jgi:hypothetical protein
MVRRVIQMQAAGGSHGQELPMEEDRPPSLLITVLLAILVVLLAVILVVSGQVLGKFTDAKKAAVYENYTNPQLAEQQAKDAGRLGSYKKNEDGSFTVPVEQAMKRIYQRGSLRFDGGGSGQ